MRLKRTLKELFESLQTGLFVVAVAAFIVMSVAPPAYADLLTHHKIVRRFGTDKHIVIAIVHPDRPGEIFFIAVTDPAAGQSREAIIPWDVMVLLDAQSGKPGEVQGKRREERKPLSLSVRKLFQSPLFSREILDIQTEKTQEMLKKQLKKEGRKDEEIKQKLFPGVLVGRIVPTSFRPGDVLRIVIATGQDQEDTHIDLVVSKYSLYETLQIQAGNYGVVEHTEQLIIPGDVPESQYPQFDPRQHVPQTRQPLAPPQGHGQPQGQFPSAPQPQGGVSAPSGFNPNTGVYMPPAPRTAHLSDRDSEFRKDGSPRGYPPNGGQPGPQGAPYGGTPPPYGSAPVGTSAAPQPSPAPIVPPLTPSGAPGGGMVPAGMHVPASSPPPPSSGFDLDKEKEFEESQRQGMQAPAPNSNERPVQPDVPFPQSGGVLAPPKPTPLLPAESSSQAPQSALLEVVFADQAGTVQPVSFEIDVQAYDDDGNAVAKPRTLLVQNGIAQLTVKAGLRYMIYLPGDVANFFAAPGESEVIKLSFKGQQLKVPAWRVVTPRHSLVFRRK